MMNPSIPVEGELTVLRPKEQTRGLRRSRRYRTGLATIGKISFQGGSAIGDAFVVNLSKTGIGLNMPHPLEVGIDLKIRLRVPGDAIPQILAMRVIHATLEADRSWRIGCEFAEPISADLLDLLLQ